MVMVHLDRYEAEHGKLPPVCMLCGASATRFVPTRFVWRPVPLPSFFTLFSPLKKATVIISLCERDYRSWQRSTALIRLGCLGTLLLWGLSIALIAGLRAWRPGVDGVQSLTNTLGGILFASLIALFVILKTARPITPVEITDRSIRLSGVSTKFTRAIKFENQNDREPG